MSLFFIVLHLNTLKKQEYRSSPVATDQFGVVFTGFVLPAAPGVIRILLRDDRQVVR